MGGSGVGDTRGVPLWGHSPPPPLGAGAAGRALLGGVEGHSAAAPGRHKSLRCGGGPALGGRAGGARTAADGARERGEAVGHPRGRAVREGGAAGAAALPGRECGGRGGGGVWDVGGLLGARMGAHGSASLHVDAGRGWAFVERIAASGRARPWMATCGRAAPQRHRSACSRRVPPGAPHYPQPPPRPSPPRPPQGSLQHFLRQHVSPWAGSVRLALSLARGLAFLHQELWRDGERPPPPPSPHVRPRSR